VALRLTQANVCWLEVREFTTENNSEVSYRGQAAVSTPYGGHEQAIYIRIIDRQTFVMKTAS